MIHQQNTFFYAETDLLQMLELPYVGDELSMVILLPKVRAGLDEVEAQFQRTNVRNWMDVMSQREVEVYLPKFAISTQFSLGEVLTAMGLPDAFSENADFSGISTAEHLCISNVLHKAIVDVNEEGTEAAAAIEVMIGATAIMKPSPVPIFNAYHQFLFLITDRQTLSLLFVGRVQNPAE